MVRNYDTAGLPAMFSAYNGKPVLIRNREGKGKGGSGRMRVLNVESGPGEERWGRAFEMSVDIGLCTHYLLAVNSTHGLYHHTISRMSLQLFGEDRALDSD